MVERCRHACAAIVSSRTPSRRAYSLRTTSLDAEPVDHRLEHERTGEDDVGPLRVEPGEIDASAAFLPGLHDRRHDRLAPARRVITAPFSVAAAPRRPAAACHAQHLLDRARRADGHLGAVAVDRPVERGRASTGRGDGTTTPPRGAGSPPAKNRLVRRTAPSFRLVAARTSSRSPMSSSVDATADVAQQQPLVEERAAPAARRGG